MDLRAWRVHALPWYASTRIGIPLCHPNNESEATITFTTPAGTKKLRPGEQWPEGGVYLVGAGAREKTMHKFDAVYYSYKLGAPKQWIVVLE